MKPTLTFMIVLLLGPLALLPAQMNTAIIRTPMGAAGAGCTTPESIIENCPQSDAVNGKRQ